MKKIYLPLLVLMAVLNAQAQSRTVNTKIAITKPLHGQYHYILSNTFFYPEYLLTNIGPDTIKVGDTIVLHDSRNAEGTFFKRTYSVGIAPGESVSFNNIVDGPGWPVYFDTTAPYSTVKGREELRTLYNVNDKNIETPALRKVHKHPFGKDTVARYRIDPVTKDTLKDPVTKKHIIDTFVIVDSARYAWFVEVADIVKAKTDPGTLSFSGNGLGFTIDTLHVWILGYSLNVVDLFASSKTTLLTYPNPANTQVSFEYDFSSLHNGSRVHLLDAMGRVVLERELDKNLYGVQKIDLDVQQLQAGIYFLRLDVDNKTLMNKFSIQR